MLYRIKIGKRIKNKILGGKQVFSTSEIRLIDVPVGSLALLEYGSFKAYASLNPLNPIRYARIVYIGENLDIGDLFYSRIKEAYEKREKFGYNGVYRLVYSESDFLSGLIIDRFNDIFVIQNSNPFFDRNIEYIKDTLLDIFGSSITIVNKSSGKSREFERLEPRIETIYGDKTIGYIQENNSTFIFDIISGQKTGWFLDQRENRLDVSKLAFGDVLDVFSYVGGFGIQIENYDTITFIEKNNTAVTYLKKNLRLNNKDNYTVLRGNAFHILKKLGFEGKKYDTIILDPPDLLQEGKYKGWKALLLINSIAMDLLKKDSIFITFSCSENVNKEKFYRAIVAIARRKGYIPILIKEYRQSKDHFVIYSHKELEYLKGFAFRMIKSSNIRDK